MNNGDTLLSRFLRYVTSDTQASETTGTHPSTPGQLVLGRAVADELRALGAADVRATDEGYVYAAVPASPGREREPPLGFLAHLDTATEASGAGVKPRVVRYEGGVLPLGDSGRALDPAELPELAGLAGATLSWRGLPCPNIGTGGHAAHGEREFLVVEQFEAAFRIVRRLACDPAARDAAVRG